MGMSMPSMESGATPSHSGSTWFDTSPGARFRRNRMSVTTDVPSRLKASDGSRIAPNEVKPSSQGYSRTLAFCLSSVKCVVTSAIAPPGLRGVDGLGEEIIVQ